MALTLSSLVISCAICYGIFYYAMWHFRRRRLYKLVSKFEGPPVLPFVGNAHLLYGNSEHVLSLLNELVSSYPSPCRTWLGPLPILLISDPEQIKAVCLSPKTLEKGSLFVDFTGPFLGAGLLTAPVSTWKVHRKLILPTFNTKILDSFVKIFSDQAKTFTEIIERNLNGPEFEIGKLISLCALDTVCQTTMGVKVRAQTDKSSKYVEAAQQLTETACERIFSVWLHPDFIFRLTKLGRDHQRYIKVLHDFTDNVIKMKRKELLERNGKQGEDDNEDDAYESRPRRNAFLEHFMTMPKGSANLSDKELREEIHNLVVAGYDTTAFTNSYTMLMLASHPEIQEKVCQELYEIYGNDDIEEHPVTAKDLPRMKYLERVIKETLRLFPTGPFITRAVTDDLEIGDHCTLPSGSAVVIPIFSLQRNEKYWPEPLKFDPDRFLPEEVSKRHQYSFMTFSAGPRNCIGSTYGIMSMKTFMATILRRFTLKKDDPVPVEGIRLKMEIFLNPVDPIKLRIERRNRN